MTILLPSSQNFIFKIAKEGKIIIIGKRNPTNGLLKIELSPKETPTPPYTFTWNSANGAIHHTQTKQDLAVLLYAYDFIPLPSTFLWVI